MVLEDSVSLLHYVDEGPKDSSETILCLHGNPTWSYYYRNVIEHFSKTARVLALDHLGCGLSSKPQNFSYQLADHIKNLTYFIDKLKLDNVTLVLHDWGGAIGLGWATEHIPKVKRLVILNTAAFRSLDIPKRIALFRWPWMGEFLLRQWNLFAWPATFLASHKGLSEEVKAGLLLPYDSYENRIAIARFVQDIPLDSKHVSYQTLATIESKLPLLTCKKLICWGAKDFCFHLGFLQRWQQIYPDAKTLVFEQAGHYVLEDETQAVLKAMDEFLYDNP